jgi:hypothetical protein
MGSETRSIKVAGRRYLAITAGLQDKGCGGIGMNQRTAEMVGGGAAIGTLIGAIVGHGKRAAIGAAVGAAALWTLEDCDDF